MPTKYSSGSIKSFLQIKNEWEQIQQQPMRTKLKSMRSIAHDILISYSNLETSNESLQFYMAALNRVARTRSFPQTISALSAKIRAEMVRRLCGEENIEILLKVNGEIMGGGTGIDVGDPDHVNFIEMKESIRNLDESSRERYFLNFMNQGRFFRVYTMGDGSRYVQLRVVNSLEPILTVKEYKFVIDSSEVGIIDVPTGSIAVASEGELNIGDKGRLLCRIEPGKYKICIFHFDIPNKIESFYIVLCKTNEGLTNHVQAFYTFE